MPTAAEAFQAGQEFQRNGDAARAEAIYRALLPVVPDWPEPALALGGLLAGTRADEAIACYRRAAAISPADPRSYAGLGMPLVAAGRLAEAAAAYRHYVRLFPDNGAGHRNLAVVIQSAGDLAGALPHFRRACELGDLASRTLLAYALKQLGRNREAETLLRQLLTEPDALSVDAVELEALGDILKSEGRLDDLRQFCRSLRQHRTQAGMARTLAAESYLDGGDWAGALRELGGLDWNHGRYFTVRSLALFHQDLATRGLARPSRRAGRGGGAVSMLSLAARGRFAQNVLEYLLVRLYTEQAGLDLETPEWVGQWFFELDDPPVSARRPMVSHMRRRLNDLVAGKPAEPLVEVDIDAPYTLYRFDPIYRERIRSWLRPRPQWRDRLDPVMDRLRRRGRTVVAIHIRRGDFAQFNYPITRTQAYLDWLDRHWPGLDAPVLYVASDAPAEVKQDFARFDPVSIHDLECRWPGQEFAQDFHVLSSADIVGISARSGFSFLAALLNGRARLCLKPEGSAAIAAFDPWLDSIG